MSVKHLEKHWQTFVERMNNKGIPMPMARYKGKANPALTLVIISSFLVISAIVGKWSGYLGGVDMGNAMEFFKVSCALFFGHSWVHRDAEDGAPPPIVGPTDQQDL